MGHLAFNGCGNLACNTVLVVVIILGSGTAYNARPVQKITHALRVLLGNYGRNCVLFVPVIIERCTCTGVCVIDACVCEHFQSLAFQLMALYFGELQLKRSVEDTEVPDNKPHSMGQAVVICTQEELIKNLRIR